MLLTSNFRKFTDTLHENPDIVIRGKSTTASINLGCTICLDDPELQMLQYALVELVENVGSHRKKDIRVWELLPKGFERWLNTSLLAFFTKPGNVVNI